ncbi:hypothetical protein [Acidovorax sp. sic0104]|uniref:hypothetical protein n=1 Tax=Acidovorax sp. sic0104 TaxID=2854784 RepID=UPI001C45E63C|nr:hypothetical protein [Acidovorax sp. sic0104]MBV7542194.1 hypothetical protein [Acidovorax sp. sic0104]
MDVTDKELVLLKATNNSHRNGIPQPERLRLDAESLIARGLVADGKAGLYVPDEVKLKLLAAGQSVGR